MATLRQKEIVNKLLEKEQQLIHVVDSDSEDYSLATNVRSGSVYIVRSQNYYKIGQTRTSVLHRVETLQIGNPHKIEIVFVILTNKYKELETKLHEHFKHRHFRGEWFELEPEDEKEIEDFLTKELWQKD